MNEDELLRKLAAIEALYAGAGTDGEAAAAAAARKRILDRLEGLKGEEPEREYQFSLADAWTRRLFLALARRYGLKPFRYKRQRRTTVMLRAPASFIDDVFWPEYQALASTLESYLAEVTERVIRQTVHEDTSDAGETEQAHRLA